MSRRESPVTTIFTFFMAAAIVVASVWAIKYVLDKDTGGSSEPPISSIEPVSNDITSEPDIVEENQLKFNYEVVHTVTLDEFKSNMTYKTDTSFNLISYEANDFVFAYYAYNLEETFFDERTSFATTFPSGPSGSGFLFHFNNYSHLSNSGNFMLRINDYVFATTTITTDRLNYRLSNYNLEFENYNKIEILKLESVKV